jgi:hypothetical protein
MAKSYTKRKTSPTVRDMAIVTDAASRYVHEWTRNETKSLLRTELLIIPADWGFQVGRYAVKSVDTAWDVYDAFNVQIGTFTNKRSAITWCLLYQTQKYKQSQRLLEQDSRLNKLTQDQTRYFYSKQRALSRKDMFAVDLYTARILKNMRPLEEARNDLEKTLNSAKYNKGIWD